MATDRDQLSAGERISALEALLAERDALIADLQAQLIELRGLLTQNSSNSHLPPSSDGPGASGRLKGRKPKAKSKRKRGGQKGHRGAYRTLIDGSKVDTVVDFYPELCSGCAVELPRVPDVDPLRYQQVDFIAHGPWVTEYRRHTVTCSRCSRRSLAEYDSSKIPTMAFGPRLTAVVVTLTGVYHLSRRRAKQLLEELFGISVSLGSISALERRASKAMAPAHKEVEAAVERATVKHTDATAWLRAGVTMSLWTLASATVTLFKIFENGKRETIRPMFGALLGILVSDRATVFGFWAMAMRQICWAYLIRKFVSFSERDGPAGDLGRELLQCAAVVFDYWHGLQDGRLTRDELVVWMQPVQRQFEATLERAVAADIRRVSGSCRDMLAHRDALWTFVTHEGVEPTNNPAERELRPVVLWRKRSFGSQCKAGERFAERVMTVAHTARKQGKSVLDFLERTIVAHVEGHVAPNLVDAAAPA